VNTTNENGNGVEARPKKSLGVRAALFALNFYKSYLSVLLAGNCRYQPTCSRFAYEAIDRFGVVKGAWLATKRLLRCQPFAKRFGYDPVPEKWEDMRPNMPVDTHGARS
jgi:putative membrane protein insertion efficiency factor